MRDSRGQIPGLEAVMEVAKSDRDGAGAMDPRVSGVPVQQVVKAAHDELRILMRHKDPMASVTTVLNRLVDYGEARSLTNDRGRRVWEWVSETDTGREPMAAQASL